MRHNRRLYFLAFFLYALLGSQIAAAQKLQIDYTVSIANPENRIFHVTTDIKNIKQAKLDLSLPTWMPGWYTVENYGKNLLRFRITDAGGKTLPHTMTRKQTWNVETKINGEDPQLTVLRDLAGKTFKLNLKREGKETESSLTVGSRDETHYVLTEVPQATAQQLKIREGWLKAGR